MRDLWTVLISCTRSIPTSQATLRHTRKVHAHNEPLWPSVEHETRIKKGTESACFPLGQTDRVIKPRARIGSAKSITIITIVRAVLPEYPFFFAQFDAEIGVLLVRNYNHYVSKYEPIEIFADVRLTTRWTNAVQTNTTIFLPSKEERCDSKITSRNVDNSYYVCFSISLGDVMNSFRIPLICCDLYTKLLFRWRQDLLQSAFASLSVFKICFFKYPLNTWSRLVGEGFTFPPQVTGPARS